jgi:hypothetical protein
MEPLARGWKNGVSLNYYFSWIVKPLGYWIGEWFFPQGAIVDWSEPIATNAQVEDEAVQAVLGMN